MPRQKLFTDPSIDDALRILLAVGVPGWDHLQNVGVDLDSTGTGWKAILAGATSRP